MVQSCEATDGIKSKHGEGVYAEMKTTMGTILIALEYQKAPLTVANFVGLAEGKIKSNKPEGTPFYDGIVFHRVIKGFMIQGGDPEGSGRGGPGYRFPDEIHPDLKHTGPGILSMANAGPNTNGSQFFITHAPTPHLDGKHAVFGKVVEGMDVVDSIASVPVDPRGNRPNKDIAIEKVAIHRVGESARAFSADQAAFDNLRAELDKKAKEKASAVVEAEKEAAQPFLDSLKKEHGDKLMKTASGMHYVILKEGTGSKPTTGAQVKAHYTGTFLDGREFDSSIKRGQPIAFPVGQRRVIPGWDEALLDMKKGEKRLLVIPSEMAYGARGAGPIKPYTTLVFEVELVDF